MAMEPGEALETAVRNAIRTSLAYQDSFCDCTFDGQPPPRCGPIYVSVWSDGATQPGPSVSTCLDEYHSVFITVTVRTVQPFDRLILHRRDLEQRINAIRALIARDRRDFSICNAANLLASYRSSGAPDSVHQPGFCESLLYQGKDRVEIKGPDWTHGDIEKATNRDCALAQTVRFGRCRRIQGFDTAS